MNAEKYRVASYELRVNLARNSSRLTTHDSRLAMTLIELMVVIVILVTLVAGVLPLVSPNNDARKISESSRSLQTYFVQAQAEAARLGRPVGIGFRETAAGSGVALEAFQMLVPPVYPGSSTLSRVTKVPGGGDQMEVPATDTTNGLTYGPRDNDLNRYGNDRTRFPDYFGAKLYALHTQLAVDLGNSRDDPLPPEMFQVGDIIEAEGNRFVIVDDPRNLTIQKFPNGPYYLKPSEHSGWMYNALVCVRLDDVLQGSKAPPLAVPPNGYSYGIHRQPMGAERTNGSPNERVITSGEAPLQLPAAISIDLMASGIEAGEMGTVFEFPRSYDTTKTPNVALPYVVGILFSPNGGVDSFWINGQRYLDVSRVFFLIGRVENGNPDSAVFAGNWSGISDDQFRDRRSKANWLNPDSRWLTINANDGRLSVSQNANVDPRIVDNNTDHDDEMRSTDPLTALKAQIEAAHELAHGGHGEDQ